MQTVKIGVLVGSLRRESYSAKIANLLSGWMPDNFEMKKIEIGSLPMFNQDLDDDGATPAEWAHFRQEVQAMDGYLFVTPEYNRSIPPVLKNAMDIASRPYGENAWAGKPGAVVSVSPGRPGAFGANHILRQSMVFLDVYMMQQPEAYIGGVTSMLDDAGNVSGESAEKFLRSIAAGFVKWVERFI